MKPEILRSVFSATAIGTAAGSVTIVSFLPQAIRVWKSRRTQDLSAVTFALLVIQAVLWSLYGIVIAQPPVIWTNVCVLILSGSILIAKLRHR